MRFDTLAEWLAWQETLHPKFIDLGLARVGGVYDKLVPGGSAPFTLTVGGTNGKGSCVAMLDAILRAQGYRVGAYTSPHILKYNERIRVDGRPVGDGSIRAAFERIDQARGDTTLSFFEFGTLAALDIFAAEQVDVRVLEVGLGGCLDAVNIIDADAALVASIDIDHRDWLGDTREAIGLEKAGIFRPGRPAISGDPDTPVSVIRYAEERGVPLRQQGLDFGYEVGEGVWTWRGGAACLADLPFPAIPGQHQLMNAAAVLAMLHGVAERLPVSPDAIRQGLRAVELAGRFQLFPGAVPVLLDVAHNPQAVNILAGHLRRHYAGRRIHAVFAVMRDKDIGGIVDNIHELIDRWYLAPLAIPRAATAQELQDIFQSRGIAAVERDFPDIGATLARVRHAARDGDLILVFGSFFLVADYLAHTA